MNRKRTVITMLALLCTAGTAGVFAYFTDTDSAKNTFTVGYNEIKIEEPDFTPPPSAVPGGMYAKKVQIRNTADTDCYVRVKVVFSDDAVKGLTEIDYNLKDWDYDAGSSYYYYRTAIPAGGITVPLMTEVRFQEDAAQEEIDALGMFTIGVVAESCQADGADGYMQAWKRMEANRPSD